MKKLKVILTAVSVAFSTSVFAQNLNFGLKAGLNLSSATIKIDGEKSDEIKMLPGLVVGAFSDINFTEKFGLETGLQFEQKGYKAEEEIYGKTATDKFTVNYLTIPVNLRLNLPVGENNLYFLAGPTFGIGLSAKEKVEYDGETETESIDFGDDGGLSRMNIGLLFGAGYELSGKLGLRVTYDLGLSNLVSDGDSDNKVSTNVLGLSITYKF